MTPSALCGTTLAEEMPSRTIPARILPVPDTVSPQMQKLIGEPVRVLPSNPADWKRMRHEWAKGAAELLAEPSRQYAVTVLPQVINGVPCYLASPNVIEPVNRERLIVAMHGGGYIFGGGPSSALEAVVIAGHSGVQTLAVDYRLAADEPFPAAMDDAMTVWKEMVKRSRPSNIALYGSSAGGGMVLALAQRAKREGVPLPAAIVSATPWSDLSKTGDSYFANAGVDNQLAYEGHLEAAAKAYAHGRDLKDPLLSPVYGDFTGFPPTLLISGTRDIFLSNTVRVHRKLRQADVDAELEVYEGQSHGQFLFSGTPEYNEYYRDVVEFIDAHTGFGTRRHRK